MSKTYIYYIVIPRSKNQWSNNNVQPLIAISDPIYFSYTKKVFRKDYKGHNNST